VSKSVIIGTDKFQRELDLLVEYKQDCVLDISCVDKVITSKFQNKTIYRCQNAW